MAKSFCESVREFQMAFNHPVGTKVHPLANDPERKALRGSWLMEELDEFNNAGSLVDKVDAIVDFQYFLSGNLVEMGIMHKQWAYMYNKFNGYKRNTLSVSDLFFDGWHRRKLAGKPGMIERGKCPYQVELELSLQLMDNYDFWEEAEDVNDEVRGIYFMQQTLIDLLIELGVTDKEYQKCFEAVHNANMAKLWPDGKPHYDETGKVKKPEGWSEHRPEPILEAILFS